VEGQRGLGVWRSWGREVLTVLRHDR
jgi:hypothetical protein